MRKPRKTNFAYSTGIYAYTGALYVMYTVHMYAKHIIMTYNTIDKNIVLHLSSSFC